MAEKHRKTRAFRRISLKPVEARLLLNAIETRTVDQALEQARRVIAAREATIDTLRLDPPASRTPQTRGGGGLSALLWPARTPEPLDRAAADLLAGSGLFLPGWYRERHRDAIGGGDAWAHYLSSGLAKGLAPNPFFDPDWYAQTHLDGRCAEPAILHYMRIGARYALAPGPLFDAAAYLLADRSLAGEADALAHFLARGIAEGRAAIPVGA